MSDAMRTFSSETAAALYDQIMVARDLDQIDSLVPQVWAGNCRGEIDDDDAAFLDGLVRSRQQSTRPPSPSARAVRSLKWFMPRRPQRSPDRAASRARRRQLGGSSAMPPALGAHYTEGERAVLCIIAGEVKRHGICDWPIGTIAAKAGVGRSTVQNALHEARRHSHIAVQARPRPGQKNLTNVVSIINRDWLEWIKRAPSAAKSLEPVVRGKQARPTAVAECGVIGSKTLNPTKIIELNTGADAQPMPPEPSVKPTDQKGAFDEGASGNTDRSPSTVAVERPQEPPKSPPATYQPGLFGADVINFDTVAGKLSSSTCTAIRAEYRARGLSQGQFAAEIGLSQAQLCNVLKGRFGLSAGATARLHGWLQRRIA